MGGGGRSQQGDAAGLESKEGGDDAEEGAPASKTSATECHVLFKL